MTGERKERMLDNVVLTHVLSDTTLRLPWSADGTSLMALDLGSLIRLHRRDGSSWFALLTKSLRCDNKTSHSRPPRPETATRAGQYIFLLSVDSQGRSDV